ncbi:MAG TPA: hypothetical protein VMF52_03270 [Steroidobacteraceae bacterium]|nr:hypothetical protein [Steroidobacteraceae bacterium]
MNVTAHRTIAPGLAGGTPGPRPPPKHLSARALTALVSQLTTGYPNPDGPDQPPGPFDPYIRRALERSVIGAGNGTNLWRVIAEKHPEIWDVIGGDPSSQLALNPQPLPPRSAFLAAVVQEFTERMTDVAQLADLIPRPGGERGIIIAGGHVAKFIDDICGNGLKIRWPFPWPAPAWFSEMLSGADLIVMGTQFQQAAVISMDRELGRTFADAAHAVLEAGAARLV